MIRHFVERADDYKGVLWSTDEFERPLHFAAIAEIGWTYRDLRL